MGSCRQGAHLLRKILSQLGAQAELVRPIELHLPGSVLNNSYRPNLVETHWS